MTKLNFSTIIKTRDGNPYIDVSAVQAAQLQTGWRKPMPVLIQVNDQPSPPWRINMIPTGTGDYYLYLHGDVRKASQTKVGDEVQVIVEFDHAYRNGPMHTMPEWFKSALDDNHTVLQNWEHLTPSRQKEILRYFSWLKSDEAKERNIAKAIHVLSGKSGRFMARDWKNGK